MNTNKIITLALTSLLVSGCVTQPQLRVVATTNALDPAKTLKALEKGTSAIKGSALLRQQGGGVITCAGLEVALNPVTPYSTERISALYGAVSGGYRSANAVRIKFEPDNDALYLSLMRKTRCDAQGFFKFDNVAEGEYFVLVGITWNTVINGANAVQGGGVFQRVSVSDGETKEVVLTSN